MARYKVECRLPDGTYYNYDFEGNLYSNDKGRYYFNNIEKIYSSSESHGDDFKVTNLWFPVPHTHMVALERIEVESEPQIDENGVVEDIVYTGRNKSPQSGQIWKDSKGTIFTVTKTNRELIVDSPDAFTFVAYSSDDL
jgi:hypothetical protein